MKIGILTSSRADYGIYRSLLNQLQKDSFFEYEVIAFGMHLSIDQGNTINVVRNENDVPIHVIGNVPSKDSEKDISRAYGLLITDFAEFWETNVFDLILAIGDRWEMSAAVQSTIPFGIKLAHIHGGETSLGSIDNIYRHQITLASKYHFCSTDIYADRVKKLIGGPENIYNVGSLSIDDLDSLNLPKWEDVKNKYEIDFDDFILVTFHPETANNRKNEDYIKCLEIVLTQLCEANNLLITKSNLDVNGSLYNQLFHKLLLKKPEKVKIVDALGKLNYFKAMERCSFLLGNSSSGIIEAASFNKWVINIGDRQKGRAQSLNVFNSEYNPSQILEATKKVSLKQKFDGSNIYKKDGTAKAITNKLKSIYNE